MGTIRSKYVPDNAQARVNGFFRLPLNVIVATGTLLSDAYPPSVIFSICASIHVVATLCQLRLVGLAGKAGKARKLR